MKEHPPINKNEKIIRTEIAEKIMKEFGIDLGGDGDVSEEVNKRIEELLAEGHTHKAQQLANLCVAYHGKQLLQPEYLSKGNSLVTFSEDTIKKLFNL